MCAHLQEYFEGTMYRRKCLIALDVLDLTSDQKRICCQIHFALLGKIVQMEKECVQTLVQVDDVPSIAEMSEMERAILRYMAGVTIHEVTKNLQQSAHNHMITAMHCTKIEYRCCQLLERLRLPQGYALEHTNDPESLKEILHRQYKTQGLTIVSDEAFNFFKLLYCKVKSVQTFRNLEKNKYNLLCATEMHLQCNEDLKDLWCTLFHTSEDKCSCPDDLDLSNQSVNNDFQLLQYELEQSLVLDMFEKVLHYFCTVHLSDIVAKYKDTILSMTTQVSIHHQIIP